MPVHARVQTLIEELKRKEKELALYADDEDAADLARLLKAVYRELADLRASVLIQEQGLGSLIPPAPARGLKAAVIVPGYPKAEITEASIEMRLSDTEVRDTNVVDHVGRGLRGILADHLAREGVVNIVKRRDPNTYGWVIRATTLVVKKTP
jgi:hypothetical protein